mmetsp:Transcript_13380/g.38386  ORF Transcript_13380/g.38386 Transcript_13380/m.38386 type:complete len:210 (-) Transcript_13380:264-893(-)
MLHQSKNTYIEFARNLCSRQSREMPRTTMSYLRLESQSGRPLDGSIHECEIMTIGFVEGSQSSVTSSKRSSCLALQRAPLGNVAQQCELLGRWPKACSLSKLRTRSGMDWTSRLSSEPASENELETLLGSAPTCTLWATVVKSQLFPRCSHCTQASPTPSTSKTTPQRPAGRSYGSSKSVNLRVMVSLTMIEEPTDHGRCRASGAGSGS